MVFYRKYRPQTIEELDSTVVREKLTAVLKDPNSIPHAFLFTGPKGLGKTSTARIIAKVVNCTAPKTKRGASGIEPCNTCDSCMSITNGTNMDVLEIDAASNRGIDEIRELKEKIKLAPIASRKKVYIIDEVHMLTTEAFNALLKTLEEPPGHALFMLCTTEPQKVPPTILSRTFHITFRKATSEELIRSFSRIVTAEKISITPEAMKHIALLADGGFRDGVKLLEEVHAVAGSEKITPELLEQKFGVLSMEGNVSHFLENLSKRETKEALGLIEKFVSEGSDIKYFMEQLLDIVHQEMLRAAGVRQSGESVKKSDLSLSELRDLLQVLSHAASEMRYSVLPQLPLELAVIEWGQGITQNHAEQNADPSGNEKVQSSASRSAEFSDIAPDTLRKLNIESAQVSVETLRKHTGNIRKIKAMYGPVGEERKAKPAPHPTANVSVLNFSAKGDITPEWLQDFWNAIIHEVRKHNHTLAGVMRGCMIKSFDRKVLIIETAYSFHREKLDNGKTKEALEQICRELTGNPVSVTIELKAA